MLNSHKKLVLFCLGTCCLMASACTRVSSKGFGGGGNDGGVADTTPDSVAEQVDGGSSEGGGDSNSDMGNLPDANALGPFQISPADNTHGDVTRLEVSPDGTQVVYLALNGAITELYGASISTPQTVRRLNGALVTDGTVTDFAISPNATPSVGRVAYLATQEDMAVTEVYSADLHSATPAPVKINGALVASANVKSIKIAPDSSKIVYLANQEDVALDRIWLAPLDGSSAAVEASEGPAATIVEQYRWTGDSNYLVFATTVQTGGGLATAGVYAVDANMLSSLNIMAFAGSTTGRLQYNIDVSADSTTVVSQQIREQNKMSVAQTVSGGSQSLYSSQSFRSRQISFAGAGPTARAVSRLHLPSTIGSRATDLVSVLLDGSGMTDTIVSAYERPSDAMSFVVAKNDVNKVVFVSRDTGTGTDTVNTVLIDGSGASVPRHATLPDGAEIDEFKVTADGRIYYRVNLPDTSTTGTSNAREELRVAHVTLNTIDQSLTPVFAGYEIIDFVPLENSDDVVVLYKSGTFPAVYQLQVISLDGNNSFLHHSPSATAEIKTGFKIIESTTTSVVYYIGLNEVTSVFSAYASRFAVTPR